MAAGEAAQDEGLEIESDVLWEHACTAPQLRSWIKRGLTVGSVWDEHGLLVPEMSYELRDKLFEATRAALMVSEIMAPVVAAMGLQYGRTERAVVDAFTKPRIAERIKRFFEFMRDLPPDEVEQFVRGLETAKMAARASGEESLKDRLRYRYGFNTPFRPYVLVASDVMQEGLDLHRECSRVVHYDLAWNPAILEQRVGRVDRLGSKTDS
ncbi:MAG: SWF/SNF helicase family protein [Deltaproteobacteria bacterium]|nr:SWF/SNF helicase family protein [Deltaproteobacteria bacterium]